MVNNGEGTQQVVQVPQSQRPSYIQLFLVIKKILNVSFKKVIYDDMFKEHNTIMEEGFNVLDLIFLGVLGRKMKGDEVN